jgi:hypothetical protein
VLKLIAATVHPAKERRNESRNEIGLDIVVLVHVHNYIQII